MDLVRENDNLNSNLNFTLDAEIVFESTSLLWLRLQLLAHLHLESLFDEL